MFVFEHSIARESSMLCRRPNSSTPLSLAPPPWILFIYFVSVSQDKKETSRKQIKEAKNRSKKIRGTGRRIAKHKAKKAAK